jgi:hypothetical protein
MIERAFTILATVLAIFAAAFLWRNNISAAFVTGTLGAVAWFLSYRFRLRANILVADDEAKNRGDSGA